jgi:hypothetical protein
MFAGLPGIGVGTLYYVLVALWMPIRELGSVVRGTSSLSRWRLIGTQIFYASGIIASIAAADRIMMWSLHIQTKTSVGPARWIYDGFKNNAPQSILAAPIMASVVLLAVVLLAVQLMRLYVKVASRPAPAPARVAPGINTESVEFAE